MCISISISSISISIYLSIYLSIYIYIYKLLYLYIISIIYITKASLVAQIVKNLPAMWETWVQSLGLGRFPGGGHGNPLQYSCLENSMDRGALDVTEQLSTPHTNKQK